MNRRNFLKTTSYIAAGSGILLPATMKESYARDFSSKEEQAKINKRANYDNLQKKILTEHGQNNYSKEQLNLINEQSQTEVNSSLLPKSYISNSNNFWDHPRKLKLKFLNTNESGEYTYFQNGQVDLNGFWKITYLLRDRRAGMMAYPDLKLLDLLCAIQAWMKFYGNNNSLIVTSGFRTRQTNRIIESAAKDSQHLYAKAVDFTVPGLDVKTIGTIAQAFQAGGVGIYPDRHFNHLDTGNVRTWTTYRKKR